MQLIHYTKEKFSLEHREYDQEELSWQAKPNGLWVSVEGDYDWKWWCESEDFKVEDLAISYEVILKEKAKILYLWNSKEICDLSNNYPYLKSQWDDPVGREVCRTYEIDWKKVKSQYQGIIIPNYIWECRLSQLSCWYYGWDCASGCIWDLTCIEEFKLRETHECNRSNSCVG
jgi:hypothetical protein